MTRAPRHSGPGRALRPAAIFAGALAMTAPPAAAQLPEGACYRLSLDADALALLPQRGVQALAVEFLRLAAWDRAAKGPYRHVRLTARMAGQGQALRDGATGAVLTAVAECRAERLSCWANDNTAYFDLRVHDADTLELRTRHFPVADYGGSMTESNLAEQADRDTVYLLTRADLIDCTVD